MCNKIQDLMDAHSITVKYEFIPFSASRSRNNDKLSMNYKMTVSVKGCDVLTTDYMQGCGHCKTYKQGDNTVHRYNLIKRECETRQAGYKLSPLPSQLDGLYSLIMDSDVIDYGCFEEWAVCMAYDSDSIKAKSIYDACLDFALRLRAAIGDAGITELREAFTDY